MAPTQLLQSIKSIKDIDTHIRKRSKDLTTFGFRQGYLGLAYYHFLQGKYSGKRGHFTYCRSAFKNSFEYINCAKTVSYPVDFTDFGFVSQNLIEAGVLKRSVNEYLWHVDKFMYDAMLAEIGNGHIGGFGCGAIGFGLHFVHRAVHNHQDCVEILKALLLEILRQQLLYFNAPQTERRLYAGSLNLHDGQAGTILFLILLAEHNLAERRLISFTLGKAMAFLLSVLETKVSGQPHICFQQGSLGLAYAILRAGQSFNNRAWITLATDLLKTCSLHARTRYEDTANVSLFDGSCGAAVFFSRVYELTNCPNIKKTAELCFEKTLSTLNQNQANGLLNKNPEWDLGFLKGITGSCAGLMRFASNNQINFDKMVWLL
jgi:hypothetical protein